MKHAAILLLLALAACGSEREVKMENASVAEVAAEVKAAGGGPRHLSAGRWESTITIDKMEVPGMPPALAARMKDAMGGGKVTSASCLTAEQAKKPAAEFFGGKDRKDCRYDRFEMDGGTIDAKLTCGAGPAGGATVTMKGSYAAERFDMAMTTDARGEAGRPGVSMAATIVSKRTGACAGTEAS